MDLQKSFMMGASGAGGGESSVSARYWGFLDVNNDLGDMAQVEFHLEDNGYTNRQVDPNSLILGLTSLGGNVTSVYTDGNLSTNTNTSYQIVYWDLGSRQAVKYLRMAFDRSTGIVEEDVIDIVYSNDGQTWNTATTLTDMSQEVNEVFTSLNYISIFPEVPTTSRFWGFTMIRGSSTTFRLSQLELLLMEGTEDVYTFDPDNLILGITSQGDYTSNALSDTTWTSNLSIAADGFIYWDLGSAKAPRYIRLGGVNTNTYIEFIVKYSIDGIYWAETLPLSTTLNGTNNFGEGYIELYPPPVPTTARYWGITVDEVTVVSTLEFHTETGTEDTGTISPNSKIAGLTSMGAISSTNATDTDLLSTIYLSAGDVLYYDLGTDMTITNVRVATEDGVVVTFRVRYSVDGVNWAYTDEISGVFPGAYPYGFIDPNFIPIPFLT